MEKEKREELRKKLAPCPFCGHTPQIQDAYDLSDGCPCYKRYRIFCNYGGCSVTVNLDLYHVTVDEAIMVWNSRRTNSEN